MQNVLWLSPENRKLLTKTLLVMKITVIILLAASLHVCATGYSQKITLSVKNASLEKVFKDIRKQSGYNFLYSYSDLKKAEPISLNVANSEITEVLNLCFKGQPLAYTIVDKVVIVKQKQ